MNNKGPAEIFAEAVPPGNRQEVLRGEGSAYEFLTYVQGRMEKAVDDKRFERGGDASEIENRKRDFLLQASICKYTLSLLPKGCETLVLNGEQKQVMRSIISRAAHTEMDTGKFSGITSQTSLALAGYLIQCALLRNNSPEKSAVERQRESTEQLVDGLGI